MWLAIVPHRESDVKDSQELRRFLLDRMVSVSEGELEVAQAKAICNLAQQVYNTLNIEVKTAQAKAKMGEGKIEPVSFDA